MTSKSLHHFKNDIQITSYLPESFQSHTVACPEAYQRCNAYPRLMVSQCGLAVLVDPLLGNKSIMTLGPSLVYPDMPPQNGSRHRVSKQRNGINAALVNAGASCSMVLFNSLSSSFFFESASSPCLSQLPALQRLW